MIERRQQRNNNLEYSRISSSSSLLPPSSISISLIEPPQLTQSLAKAAETTTKCIPIFRSYNNKFTTFNSLQKWTLLIVTTILIVLVENCIGAPAPKTSQAEIYLSQFGYLPPAARNPSSGGLLDESTWIKAIQEFQSFAGLNVTGELDDETMHTMQLPRCGVRDKVGFGSDSRAKRYALQGSRWKVKSLSYKISQYPKRLKKNDVDSVISKAFGVWGAYTDLTFTQKKSGPVHIDIKFAEGEHGDGDPFDGPSGTLAHAYFPVYGGDAHFDDAEHWTIGAYSGTNLFQVAAHEFGHSLGLSHSDTRSALMAPFYRGYDPVFRLDSDDVAAIQALYGRKTNIIPTDSGTTTRPTIPTRRTKPRDDSDLCKDPKIDALFNSPDGQTFAFKGDKYYKLTENSIADGYPKLIADTWIGLPGDIDAAFTYKNGKTYFFKGTKYWRYNGGKVDGVYPKEINEGFTGIPDHLDAAMVWGGNGKIYFYKGSKFWRFDPMKRPPVKATYPKPISNWEGLPNNIDASVQYTNGYTYFFKGDKYYRFNDRTFSVDQADPPFPRPSGYWWFGCKNVPSSFNSLGEVKAAEENSEQYHSSDHTSNRDVIDDTLIFDAAAENEGHKPHDELNGNSAGNRITTTAVFPSTSSSGSSILLTSILIYAIANFLLR